MTEIKTTLLTDTEPDLRIGFRSHRLQINDPYFKKEIDFVKAVNDEIKKDPQFLAQLVGKEGHKNYLNENDERVALSIIQWLGTPVGQIFLEKVSRM